MNNEKLYHVAVSPSDARSIHADLLKDDKELRKGRRRLVISSVLLATFGLGAAVSEVSALSAAAKDAPIATAADLANASRDLSGIPDTLKVTGSNGVGVGPIKVGKHTGSIDGTKAHNQAKAAEIAIQSAPNIPQAETTQWVAEINNNIAVVQNGKITHVRGWTLTYGDKFKQRSDPFWQQRDQFQRLAGEMNGAKNNLISQLPPDMRAHAGDMVGYNAQLSSAEGQDSLKRDILAGLAAASAIVVWRRRRAFMEEHPSMRIPLPDGRTAVITAKTPVENLPPVLQPKSARLQARLYSQEQYRELR